MRKYNPTEEAYKLLTDVEGATMVIEEAIGFLGEALDD